MAKPIFNLANNLTITRIIIVPILIVLVLYSSSRTSCMIAALLFALAAVTDWLDGYIARRQNLVTSLGKFLDPLADKLLVSVALVMLLSLNRVPAWMVALIIAREVGVTGLRIAAARDGIIMESSRLAKYKTAFQLVAVEALLIHYTYAGIDFHLVGMLTLWIALFVSLWSGIVYFIRFFKKTLSPSPGSP
jgi:CDP-diacylglycerol--glycerol-3-phosphate 3-phosphatidyltransferase